MAIDYTKRPSKTPPAGGVSLSKVTLTKSVPSVSLTKHGGASGELRVNLQWTARPGSGSRGGLFRSAGIDLDLACLWEFTSGEKGVVQALGASFTSPGRGRPVIRLDGDDRSGAASSGENLFVDLSQLASIKRILVFTYIYEGAPNWAAADGVVTLFPASGPQIEVRLDEHDPASRFCAIALLENAGGDLSVRREVRYVEGGHRAVDQAYGWGMRWSTGRK